MARRARRSFTLAPRSVRQPEPCAELQSAGGDTPRAQARWAGGGGAATLTVPGGHWPFLRAVVLAGTRRVSWQSSARGPGEGVPPLRRTALQRGFPERDCSSSG